MISQMKILYVPMDNFLSSDYKNMKELSKKFDRATSHSQSVVNKVNRIHKRNTIKSQEIEIERTEAKRKERMAALDLVMKMNEIHVKKKHELLENVCSFMYTQLAFFHQGYEFCKELIPYLRTLSTHLQTSRMEFEDERRRLQKKRARIVAVRERRFFPSFLMIYVGRIWKGREGRSF